MLYRGVISKLSLFMLVEKWWDNHAGWMYNWLCYGGLLG